MATLVQGVPASPRSQWFWDFLKDELALYPGRAGTVARMVIAGTLVMIVCMTFRIPYAFQGSIYAFLVSRDSPRATLQSAGTVLLATAIGAAYLLVSITLVINFPAVHFLWVIGTLFLAFYAISVLTSYNAAITFAIVIAVGLPLWDRHVSAEVNVEDTLWLCLAILIGIVVTAGVELAFVRLQPGDELILHITERSSAVQNLLTCYADGRAVDPATEQKIIRLQMLGTSMFRRILRRSGYPRRRSANMGGLAAVVGRLVDLAATLTQLDVKPSASAQRRLRNLASALARIRSDLANHENPGSVHFDTDEEPAGAVPLLGEMEDTVTLIPEVFAGSRSIHGYVPTPGDLPQSTVFAGALTDPEHLRFAVRGCLSASACYVIYNAIAWPGISTAVVTCLLTALSTIGSSRQKQVLRIMGAMVGGFLLGMGSQVFVLPHLESIGGFVVLFAAVTAFSAWFATSSPRLSYFGVQVALAFYLINLQEFTMQTSLSIARDRVVGVLLGLFMMWLVFDRLWGAPAAVAMRRVFISSIRLLAQLAREPVSNDIGTAIKDSFALRERISAQLDGVRALADGVIFEFGPGRSRALKLRNRIRQWQPRLWALFLMRVASLKYRLELPGFELPEPVRVYQREYDERSAQTLEQMADAMDGKPSNTEFDAEDSSKRLERLILESREQRSQTVSAVHVDSFAALVGEIDRLTASLAEEIGTTSLNGEI